MSDMDKKIALALFLTVIMGGVFLVYWLNEPARMAAASERFRLQTVVQGEELYAEHCAGCHGAEGQGVPPIGSALNSKDLLTAMDDATIHQVTRDGRPNTAMPAFGEEHGGPLNEHQIDQMTAFIRNWESTAPTLPSRPQEERSERIARGGELYEATCTFCHGDNGQGGSSRALNSEEYLKAFDDEYLKEAIGEGRPRQGMPTWGKVLSPSQIDDLVAFMRNWEGSWESGEQVQPTSIPEATPTPEPPSVRGDAARGVELYDASCAACHGAEGGGGTVAKEPMNTVEFLEGQSDDDLRQAISDGVGTAMPGFGGRLTDQEIADMIALFRSWAAGRQAQPTPTPDATPTAESPKTEGDATKGAELYAANCAPCHGAEGEGGAAAEEPMNTAEFLESQSDDALYQAISDGVGTAMPGFESRLTAREIADIIALFRSWE